MRKLSRTTAKIRTGCAVLVGIVLLATGCSEPTAAPSLGEVEVGSDLGLLGEGSAFVRRQQGALDEVLDRIWTGSSGSIEYQQERNRLLNLQSQEFIAACMADQGFPYLVGEPPSLVITEFAEPLPGTREFAALHGFGIAVDPNSDMPGIGRFGANPEPGYDPNQAIRNAMSTAELAAWEYALHGDPFAPLVDGQTNWSVRGCIGQSVIATTPQLQPEWEFAAIQNEVDRFSESILIDPQMLLLNAEWAGCMSSLGHPGLQSRTQLQTDLHREWWPLQDQDSRLDMIVDWDHVRYPDGPPGTYFDADGVLQLEGVAVASANFRQREIELALADFDCRARTDFAPRQQDINLRLQQEFVDRNRAELEAWATFMESHLLVPAL